MWPMNVGSYFGFDLTFDVYQKSIFDLPAFCVAVEIYIVKQFEEITN